MQNGPEASTTRREIAEKTESSPQKKTTYLYATQTDDPKYAPVSLGDMQAMREEIMSRLPSLRPEPRGRLYVIAGKGPYVVPDIPSSLGMKDILSLTLSTTLGAALLVMGFIASLTEVLPNRFFWWAMACPAIGTAFADFLTIYGKLRGTDQ